jgi:hypothetical protein
VTTRAKTAAAATFVDRQDLGGTINEPFGRGRRRRPHHNLETGARQRFDRAIQPGPVEFARARFDRTPGELANPDKFEAKTGHTPSVIGPHIRRPMLGVVANAQHEYSLIPPRPFVER